MLHLCLRDQKPFTDLLSPKPIPGNKGWIPNMNYHLFLYFLHIDEHTVCDLVVLVKITLKYLSTWSSKFNLSLRSGWFMSPRLLSLWKKYLIIKPEETSNKIFICAVCNISSCGSLVKNTQVSGVIQPSNTLILHHSKRLKFRTFIIICSSGFSRLGWTSSSPYLAGRL